jgi:predicted dehydrogenase
MGVCYRQAPAGLGRVVDHRKQELSVPEEEMGAVVFGTSFGVLTHVRALRNAGFAVLGLVGRDGQKTKERAEFLGIPHALTDVEEAVRLPGVEVVAVATPPHTHRPISLAAIRAGRHVLCEKPFALDLAEAREMREAADRAGVVHVLGTEFRFATPQATLRRVVRSGVIGAPRTAVFALHMPSLVHPSVELPAWWELTADGGGWLGAYGSHVIDQVRITIGEFEAVSASLQTLAPRPSMTADDTYTVHFRLAGGCTGILHSSCAIGGQSIATTKITGTRGSAWIQNAEIPKTEHIPEGNLLVQVNDRGEVWIDTGSGAERVPDPDDLPRALPIPPPPEVHPPYAKTTKWHTSGTDLAPYTRVYEGLRARVLGHPAVDDPPLATFADGEAQQAVMDATRRSAAGGTWVEVSSSD